VEANLLLKRNKKEIERWPPREERGGHLYLGQRWQHTTTSNLSGWPFYYYYFFISKKSNSRPEKISMCFSK
jgi:hypothetical protein